MKQYIEKYLNFLPLTRTSIVLIHMNPTIAANKVPGIRCALCTDCFMAQATREHNDANMLAFGARVLGAGTALKIVDTFLDTPFSNDERHKRRIAKIEKGE